MIFSFYNTFVQSSPELDERGDGWPVPPSFYDPDRGRRIYEEGIEEVRLADELGFDWVSASEHHYWNVSPTPNAAVLLGALTQVVKRAKLAFLGPLVSINNPIRLAEEVAMLDQMSNGNLVVLFLRGTPNEFLAYDVMPEETRARTQEAMCLIHRALTEPEPFGWEGRYFRFRTVSVWPGPTQRPTPPLFAAGTSIESVTWAARHGYPMAVAFYPMEKCADLTARYREECAANGWTPTSEQMLYRAFVAIAETDEQAEELQARFYGSGAQMSAVRKGRGALVADQRHTAELAAAQPSTGADGKSEGAQTIIRGFALGGLAFCGSPETVRKQIEEFHRETGVGVFDLSFNGGGLTHEEHMRSIRLFATHVIPSLKSVGVNSQATNTSEKNDYAAA